jgi:hypothetical protein
VSFTVADYGNNSVLIKWQTASETNNDFFTIERSKNGRNWEIVEKILSKSINGLSTLPLHYSTIDTIPYSELSYYQLKQTDFDGQFEYSPIRSVIIDRVLNTQILVYPNPSENQISIVGTRAELNEIRVFSLLGQDVSSLIKQIFADKSRLVIDLSNLKSGVYFLKTKDGSVKVYKR